MHILNKWIFLSPVLLLLACSPKTTPVGNTYKLDPVEQHEMIAALQQINDEVPEHFFAKTDTKFQNKKNNYSFKTSLRMVKDSALNAFITYAKIPIITAQIETDSVHIINRREKCFIQEKLDFFKANFGVDFSYENIQQIFLGKAIGFELDNVFTISPDPYHYILSTFNKKATKDGNAFVITYHFNNDLKTLRSTTMESADKSTKVTIEYINYQEVEKYNFPKTIILQIKTPKDTHLVTLNYETIEVNTPRELSIVIPENYVRCQ